MKRSIALAVAAGVMLTASLALAGGGGGGAKIEATGFSVDDPGAAVDEFARCGSGKRALGGGVVQSGSADNLYVNASGPLDRSGVTVNTGDGDKAKQWYAAVSNDSGTDNRAFKVFAICSDDSDAKIESTQLSVDANTVSEGFAKCGAGRRALGGGVVYSGSGVDLWVLASGPLDGSGVTLNTDDGDKAKQWYAAVHNQTAGNDRIFRVYAICSEDSRAKIETKQFRADGGETREAFAKCGRGKRALGGGLVQSGAPNLMYVSANGPLDATGVTAETRDGDKAKQWYGAISNLSGTDDRVFRVSAICE